MTNLDMSYGVDDKDSQAPDAATAAAENDTPQTPITTPPLGVSPEDRMRLMLDVLPDTGMRRDSYKPKKTSGIVAWFNNLVTRIQR